MTPEQYQAARARASLVLLAALRPLARLLRPRPTAAERAAWVDSAYPAVYRARVDHHAAAQEFYLAERARFGITGQTPVPLRNYAPQALDTALREENVWGRLDALGDDDPVPTVIISDMLAIADRHGTAGGRDAIVDAARHDRRALGYARTTTGLENCAFCLLLVSRGPVYKSEDTALLRDGTGEPYHDRCDCIAVPVYDRNDWPGRDEYLEMEAAWREHGGDLQSWRTYIENREGSLASASGTEPRSAAGSQGEASNQAASDGAGTPPANPPAPSDPDDPADEWHMTHEGLGHIVEGVRSGIRDREEVEGGGGGSNEIERVEFNNGVVAVRKVAVDWPWDDSDQLGGISEKDRADAEQLASLVGRAVGADVPAVYRTDVDEMYMDFVDGGSGYEYPRGARAALAATPSGRLLGLLDVLVDNSDRNPGNWLTVADGVAGIDHGEAWLQGGRTEQSGDPLVLAGWASFGQIFASHFYDFDSGSWMDHDIPGSVLDDMHDRIIRLRPQFEMLRRGRWFDDMMDRFQQVRSHARDGGD